MTKSEIVMELIRISTQARELNKQADKLALKTFVLDNNIDKLMSDIANGTEPETVVVKLELDGDELAKKTSTNATDIFLS